MQYGVSMFGMTTASGFALVAIFVGASANAITGIGFALICAPLLTLTLGGTHGVRLACALAIAVNILNLRRELSDVRVIHVALLLAPASIAAPVTAWAISGLNPQLSSVVAGALVVFAVMVLAKGFRFERLTGKAGATIAGAVSGAMNVAGGVGGAAAASYALNADWSPRKTRATLAAYFLGMNVISVAALGVPRIRGVFLVQATVVLIVGFALGGSLSRRLDHNLIRRVTLALAGSGGMAALVDGLV
jgi:uncharacterized membrane protein YfcA